MSDIGQRVNFAKASPTRRTVSVVISLTAAIVFVLTGSACGNASIPSAHIPRSGNSVLPKAAGTTRSSVSPAPNNGVSPSPGQSMGGDWVPPLHVPSGLVSSTGQHGLPGPASPKPGAPGPPRVFGISPASGSEAGGDSVTISGSNLSHALQVRFGDTSAPRILANSDTEITAISPPGTGTVNITVVTRSATSPTGHAGLFTYVAGSPTVGGSPS
jgi:IPT/TIG domain